MADQSDQRIVDIRQESKIDPTRVTQRVLRSVLVSVAIIGGSVAVLVERRAARVVGIARCGVELKGLCEAEVLENVERTEDRQSGVYSTACV